MSYKLLKVNTVSPDSSNDISIDDTNLISVDGPAVNCVLRKSPTGWNTASTLKSYNGHLNYRSDNQPGGNYYYDTGDNYVARKAGGEFNLSTSVTLIDSSGTLVPAASTSWCMAYELDGSTFNGKTVLFRAVLGMSRTSGSHCVFQWRIGTGSITGTTAIGPKTYSNVVGSSIAYGLYTGTGTTEQIAIRINSVAGNNKITQGTIAQVQSITAKIIE